MGNKDDGVRIVETTDWDFLARMDAQIFFPSDSYSAEQFGRCKCWIIQVGGQAVGSIALLPNFDLDSEGREISMSGSLYIAGTGIMPEWRGKGLGMLAKAFELHYAKTNGFSTVVTACRSKNKAIRNLNEKFGFLSRQRIKNAYTSPSDDAIVMELYHP